MTQPPWGVLSVIELWEGPHDGALPCDGWAGESLRELAKKGVDKPRQERYPWGTPAQCRVAAPGIPGEGSSPTRAFSKVSQECTDQQTARAKVSSERRGGNLELVSASVWSFREGQLGVGRGAESIFVKSRQAAPLLGGTACVVEVWGARSLCSGSFGKWLVKSATFVR